MRILFLTTIIFITACEVKKTGDSAIEHRYMKLDTTFTSKEGFNDSVCKLAIDSANRRFKKNKFELYVFYQPDSSATPIQLLRSLFRMQTLTFAREDFVFKFCYNDAMISAFKERHHFDPIDSVTTIYDSLLSIGQTQKNAEFPGGFDALEKYMSCNLKFPDGADLTPPYPSVRVGFRISPTGYPDKIEIMGAFSEKYDSAVLELIRTMPKWSPAQDDYGKYQENVIQWQCTFDPIERRKYCR